MKSCAKTSGAVPPPLPALPCPLGLAGLQCGPGKRCPDESPVASYSQGFSNTHREFCLDSSIVFWVHPASLESKDPRGETGFPCPRSVSGWGG